MTNKQKVKSIFPEAYSFIRDGGSYEVWADNRDGKWDSNLQLYYLADGKNWRDAWKNAWIATQKKMLEKLENA